jgi:hypothetical protein
MKQPDTYSAFRLLHALAPLLSRDFREGAGAVVGATTKGTFCILISSLLKEHAITDLTVVPDGQTAQP